MFKFFKLSLNAPIVATASTPSYDGLLVPLHKPVPGAEGMNAQAWAQLRDENTGLVPPEIIKAAHEYNTDNGYCSEHHKYHCHLPKPMGDPGTPGRMYSDYMSDADLKAFWSKNLGELRGELPTHINDFYEGF